jgi:outer membrane protein assembly factor BamB
MRVRSGVWIGVVLAAVVSLKAAAYDQSEYAVTSQINLAHTGNIDFAAGFAPPLVKAWTTNIGVDQNILIQPLVAQNSVFVVANGIEVFALDLATGKQTWKHALPCCGEQGAYDNGKLFFLSHSGLLTALSARTGAKLWRVQLMGESSFSVGPIASGSRVYANGEGDNAIAYSVRESDGALLWTRNLTGAGLPLLGDGGLFLTSGCFYYRLSPLNGALLWENQQCVGGGPDPSAYLGQRLYVPAYPAGNIVETGAGKIVGTYPTYGSVAAVFPVKRKVFGISQQGDKTLGCWDASTGQLVWSFFAPFELQTPPIVVNGVVYITDASGNLFGLKAETGRQTWSDNVGDLGYAPFISAGQNMLVVANDSTVIAYRSH